ncbi:unnamed protein product, partial [Didymodactylos carnosus]
DYETFTLVWLDINNSTDEHFQLQQKLGLNFNYFRIFILVEECEQYLRQQDENQQISLIVSGSHGRRLVPLVHNLKQITAIYIYCMNKSDNEKWSRPFEKVLAVITDSDELIKRVCQDQEEREKIEELTMTSMKITNKLSSESTDFICSQLWLEILLRMKQTEYDKQVFIEFCKEIYAENSIQTEIIRKFEQTYSSEQALSWYTKDTFLYKMLNKALRTNNIQTLFLFRFFITDLCQQLKQIHQQQKPVVKVYCGKLLTIERINTMYASIGHYLLINTFLSTTTDRNVAVAALSLTTTNDNQLQSVIFEILLDFSHTPTTKPYANIRNLLNFETENEILISIGSIFKIENVKYYQNQWIVSLQSCNEHTDNQLKQILHYSRQELELDTFDNLLLDKMDKFDRAEKYFKYLLQKSSITIEDNDRNTIQAWCYQCLGYIAQKEGQYPSAIENHLKALELIEKTSTSNDKDLSLYYNNLGLAYYCNNDVDKAMEIYKKSCCDKCYLKNGNKQHICTSRSFLLSRYNVSRSLTRDVVLFLWYQLLARIMNEKSIQICYNMKRKNTTQNTFLFRVLNKAIKTRNIEKLIEFRYSLFDIHNQMTNVYQFQGIAYRGMKIDQNELTRYSTHLNELILFNGYLSTTRNRDVALKFANINDNYDDNVQSVLFEIHSNPSVETRTIINVDDDEVIFDIPTVFKIVDIDENSTSKLITVFLQTTNEHIGLLHQYYALAEKQMLASTPQLLFARLMYYLGDYKKADIYVKQIGDMLNENTENLAVFYYDIAFNYYSHEEYYDALNTYHFLFKYTNDYVLISQAMKYVANIYVERNEYVEAMNFYKQSIEIQRCIREPDFSLIAHSHSLLGMLYQKQNQYDQALWHHEQALQIEIKQGDELVIAECHFNIGTIYEEMEQYKLALQNIEKALEIRTKLLQSTHPSIAMCYDRLAHVYRTQKHNDLALKYFLITLRIQKENLPENHPDIEETIFEINDLLCEHPEYDNQQTTAVTDNEDNCEICIDQQPDLPSRVKIIVLDDNNSLTLHLNGLNENENEHLISFHSDTESFFQYIHNHIENFKLITVLPKLFILSEILAKLQTIEQISSIYIYTDDDQDVNYYRTFSQQFSKIHDVCIGNDLQFRLILDLTTFYRKLGNHCVLERNNSEAEYCYAKAQKYVKLLSKSIESK